MNKSQFLADLQTSRWRWELALSRVNEERAELPTMHGGWSVKDTIGHVAYYERWLLNWLEAAVRGKVMVATHRDLLTVDEHNALIYVENKNRRMYDIQDDSRRVFERLYQLVKTLPEVDLIEPYRFDRYVVPLWDKTQPLWQCIAGETSEHYPEHTENIRKWLEESETQIAKENLPRSG